MQIPYQISIPWPKPRRLAELIATQHPSLWLDSADDKHPEGKHSYLALQTLVTWHWDDQGQVSWQEGDQAPSSSSWQRLQDWYESCSATLMKTPPPSPLFWGGLMGFLSYEAWSDQLPWTDKKYDKALPLAKFFVVDTWLHLDHQNQRATVYSWGLKPGLQEIEEALAKRRAQDLASLLSMEPKESRHLSALELKPLSDPQNYFTQVQQVQGALEAGDCYQINLAQKFSAPPVKDAAEFYLKLRTASPAPQMAFINLGEVKICSASPEILLKAQGRHLSSHPIKGTRPCLPDAQQDQAQQQDLMESEKDAAELLMIVDLVRHDLGQVAELGSVQVSQLKALQTFSHVHHLVASVEATLQKDKTIFEALRALFPGGSITGAPKRKAMEWIHRLEDFPRGIYTGSLGYLGFGGQACFNIAIRTAVLKPEALEYFAGGGIVMDSDPQQEYQESWDKTQGLLAALSGN